MRTGFPAAFIFFLRPEGSKFLAVISPLMGDEVPLSGRIKKGVIYSAARTWFKASPLTPTPRQRYIDRK